MAAILAVILDMCTTDGISIFNKDTNEAVDFQTNLNGTSKLKYGHLNIVAAILEAIFNVLLQLTGSGVLDKSIIGMSDSNNLIKDTTVNFFKVK